MIANLIGIWRKNLWIFRMLTSGSAPECWSLRSSLLQPPTARRGTWPSSEWPWGCSTSAPPLTTRGTNSLLFRNLRSMRGTLLSTRIIPDTREMVVLLSSMTSGWSSFPEQLSSISWPSQSAWAPSPPSPRGTPWWLAGGRLILTNSLSQRMESIQMTSSSSR